MSKLPELLLKKEVREILRCSGSTIDRLRESGELPWLKVKGRVMFKKTAVEDYVRKCAEVELETEQE